MTSAYRPAIIQSAFVDFIGTKLHPFWSLSTPKLRLIARVALSEDLIALQFESNRAFKQQIFGANKGWHGGQHINLSVPIDSIYHQRSYSLVGLPQQLLWWHDLNNNPTNNQKFNNEQAHKQQSDTITIAIKPQGIVSHYLTKQAPIGTIFTSGVPSGDFTLAQADLVTKLAAEALSNEGLNTENLDTESLDDKNLDAANLPSKNSNKPSSKYLNHQPSLLFIASGSGITPMLGLIKQALAFKRQVTLLHYNQTPLLASYWQELAKEYATFNYHLINTDDSSTYLANSRHLSVQSLLALELPLADTQIFACGSQAFLAELYRVAAEITLSNNKSLRDNIIIERFGSALPELDSDGKDISSDIEPQTIHLRARQRQFSSNSTLLVGAEQAGMRLNYGCRQGICQMCRCNKVSGVVKNIQTGKLSGDGMESIQTCINVAMTEVVLDI